MENEQHKDNDKFIANNLKCHISLQIDSKWGIISKLITIQNGANTKSIG